MDLATLILEYIKVLIWPALGIMLLIAFRKQISNFVSRIASSANELDVKIGSNSLKVKIITDTIQKAIEESVSKAANIEGREQLEEIVSVETKRVTKVASLSALAIDILIILGTEYKERRDERSIQLEIQQRYALKDVPTNAVSNAILELERSELIKQAGVVQGIFYPPPLRYVLTEDGKDVLKDIQRSLDIHYQNGHSNT